MLAKRLIKSNDAGGGACTNTVDLYNPFPDGGGVALYQLNGDATDVSGNYDGTATNVTYGAGQFGQAGVFNGTSSYVSGLPTLTNVSSEFSVSLWLKYTTNPSSGFKYVFGGIKEQGAEDSLVGIVVNDSGNIGYFTRGSNSSTVHQIFSSADFTNGWHNVVIISDSTNMSLYVDGNNINTLSVSPTITVDNSVLGAINSRGTIEEHFPCSIDQVRIFNRALRPYEVEALYTEEYCTPTIVPSEHFNTVTYTGNGGTQSITGVGFQPDFTWIKPRSFADNHVLSDSVRGVNKSLASNTTSSENSLGITSFDSDGFSLPQWGNVTSNGNDFVAWNFKAGGAAVTNTDGTITSQVSANTEAGFSIVTWSGDSSAATIGHGLGKKPNVIIFRNRTTTSNWLFVDTNINQGGYLDLTNSFTSARYDAWLNNAEPTDSLLPLGAFSYTNGPSMLAYCFAEVEGFSNFGSYVGNGSTSGSTVVTGFEPAMVIIKRTDSTGDWRIWDNKRSIENPRNEVLKPNTSEAEETNSPNAVIDFLENGFQPKSTHSSVNASGASYIYMAFAADPTTIEPTLEDSFNTVLYTGNGGTQSVTGVGFEPSMVWLKDRDNVTNHQLVDAVRGFNNGGFGGANTYLNLVPNETYAENTSSSNFQNYGYLTSLDSDGFTVVNGSGHPADSYNSNGNDFVAWAWKGAELPAINSNGSIPSVVSANPAAGFSIVSYTGNNIAGATIGHGLGAEPDMIIVKNRDTTDIWTVQHSALTYTDYIDLSSTNAATTNTAVWYAQPTTEVFSFGANPRGNGSGNKHIAYCFAEVAGFSKFGSYTGNGSNQYVNLGFEPAFIMVKRTNGTGTWGMFDNKRGLSAPQPRLLANDSAAENTGTTYWASTDSTGFTVQGSSIYGTGDFIYMAFANQF